MQGDHGSVSLTEAATITIQAAGWVCTVHCILYAVCYILDTVYCTVGSVQCTVGSVKCTVYSEQCTVYSVEFMGGQRDTRTADTRAPGHISHN